ncbi:MAG: pseudouridine-5'-phosphate glycosidase [Bacilli bacterium]
MNYLHISDEVKNALYNNQPIVALESTIIAHGMPYPQNVETALKAEKIIRDQGCTPATIAIINGVLKVGLTEEEINYLGKQGKKVMKVSRRDIPYLITKKLDGATTVSATMIIANMATIKVFATGGIGGVHRNAENTYDISADLEELSKTKVAVVCAGAKSILDLNKTMEYLETKGVSVIGYKTDYLPAFYTESSNIPVSHRLDTAEEIGEFLYAKWKINLDGGVVIANPIPHEFSIDESIINHAIEVALQKMQDKNIVGKDATPFLLEEIVKLTNGKSLISNTELVYNNCILASQIAKALVNQ